MLWPEGSQSVIADLGNYLDPKVTNEKFQSICLSKKGSYLVLASKTILALYRLTPLCPLAIYPTLFPNTEIKEVITSSDGSYVAVATLDNKVSVFKIQPEGDLEERFRFTYPVTPGPGEAIGAQEIYMEPVDSFLCEFKIKQLGSWGPFLVVFGVNTVQISEWSSLCSKDPLHPPVIKNFPINDEVLGGCLGPIAKNKWIVCVLTVKGVEILHFNGLDSQCLTLLSQKCVLKSQQFCTCDYNFRLKLLALGSANDNSVVILSNLVNSDTPSVFQFKTESKVSYVKWAPSGTSMITGFKSGWGVYSRLGMCLFLGQHGVLSAEWFVSADKCCLLCSDGEVRVQKVIKQGGSNLAEQPRPLLHGNGRLMVYHDAKFMENNWFTIPLPTWYMASNAPITYTASTSDGRFLAIAGTVGVMLFSISTKQWKEVGDRESVVRGGLCWFGRRLVTANQTSDQTVTLKMYSPAMNKGQRSERSAFNMNLGSLGAGGTSTGTGAPQNSMTNLSRPSISITENGLKSSRRGSSSSLNLRYEDQTPDTTNMKTPLTASSPSTKLMPAYSGFELQVMASETLGSVNDSSVVLMAKGPQSLLGVIVQYDITRLFVYDLKGMEFDLKCDIPLSEVITEWEDGCGYRQMAIVNERQVLLLVDVTLILITETGVDEYQKQKIAEPIESFDYLSGESLICMFDGQEAVIMNFPIDPSRGKFVANFGLDAYPVHFSARRGTVSLVESASVRSFDKSFWVAKAMLTQEVFVPPLLEAALTATTGSNFETAYEIALKYSKAPFFSSALETLLYKTVTKSSSMETSSVLKLIRSFNVNFNAIIAKCARKIDAKYWPQLFIAVEKSPKQIFDECLASNDLQTASELVIVTQAYTPTNKTSEFDLQDLLTLYKAAESVKLYSICKQICKYIVSADPTLNEMKRFMAMI